MVIDNELQTFELQYIFLLPLCGHVCSEGPVWTCVRSVGTVWTYIHLVGTAWICVCRVKFYRVDIFCWLLTVSLTHYT